MEIEYSENFLREAKQLSKKYKLLSSDLKSGVAEIESLSDEELGEILKQFMSDK